MNKIKNLSAVVIVATLLIANPFEIFAQGGGGPVPPHVLPLEGGVLALLAAGVVFGIKKFVRKSK